ncbi:MAG: DUF1697 domain-containing protein [Myxococcales bacterium]|nr:DUF1697 domain-containing protein [Myxococcales bacterium]
MGKTLKTQVALLRGINVAGKKKVPMAELREQAAKLGFESVQTYIQSGNLVYRSTLSVAAAQEALEKAIAEHFGFDVEAVVRTGARWLEYARESAFPDAEEARPNTLLLAIAKTSPKADALKTILAYAKNERAQLLGDALWIDYVDGSGRSKIRPAIIQRAMGSSATTRNWRTVQKIAELVRETSNS